MARAGVLVDEVIPCPGLGSGTAAEHLVHIISGGGEYQAVNVGPDRIQFARTFRPTWALVLGICLLPVLLLGVVFLFVKTTETCTALIEEDHRGTSIRLGGRLDRDLLARLREVFTDPTAAAAAAAAAGAVGAPVASAYEPVARAAVQADGVRAVGTGLGAPISSVPGADGVAGSSPAGAAPAAALAGAPAVAPQGVPSLGALPPPVGSPLGMSAPEGVAMGRPAAVQPTGPRLVLDDGRGLVLDRLVLIGRDPAPADGESTAYLVPVDDPGRTVSKTHLAVQLVDGRVVVVDRNSTNGSFVTPPDGAERQLAPGEPVEAPPGSTVRFGARTLVVTEQAAGGAL